MKRFWALYRDAVSNNKDLIVFPIVGAVMWFIQTIAIPNFDIRCLASVDAWISSFIITFLTYMIFDMLFSRISFFEKHKYLLSALSFVVSTFIGGSLSYQVKENITWQLWVTAGVEYIAGFIILFIASAVGFSFGTNKEEKKVRDMESRFKEDMAKMSNAQKRKLRSSCDKALKLDDDVFSLIIMMQSKEAIACMKKEYLDKPNS